MKMNKIILFVLLFSLLFSNAITFADVDNVPEREWILKDKTVNTELTENDLANYSLLSYLGVINEKKENFDGEEEVLRGYAAGVISLMVTDVLFTAPEAPYSDCLLKNEFVDGVYTAKELGILKNEKKFYPMKAITPKEAAEFIINALKVSIAYPNQTNEQIADKMELYKGVDRNSQTLTKSDLMKMIVNAFNSNSVKVEYREGGMYVEIDKEETFLEKDKNIILLKGVVTAHKTASLFGETFIEDGKIEINRNIYNTVYESGGILTGRSIAAYADSEDDNKIIYIAEDKKLSHVTKIYKDNIEEISKNIIEYSDENNSLKRLRIDNGAKVIYNNLYAGAYSDFDIKEYECIELIDNDGNERADCIFIYNYDYYLIDKVAEYSQNISMYQNDRVISLDDNVCQSASILFYDNNEYIDISNLKRNDAVAVMEAVNSGGKRIYSITVSRKTVNGKLEKVGTDDGTYYTIEGIKYRLSDEYEKYLSENTSDSKPKIGDKFIYYLSFDGKIVMSKPQTDEFSYAYLLKGYYDDENDESAVTVYTLSGEMMKLYLSEKVKFYDENCISGVKLEREKAYNMIAPGRDITNQMIAYKTDSDGNIKEIAMEYDLSGKAPGSIDYPITKNLTVGGDYGVGWLYFNVLSQGYYVGKGVTVMTVPDSKSKFDSLMNFSIGTANVFGQDKRFTDDRLVIYNADKFYSASFCVNIGVSGVNIDRFLRAYMLSDVYNTIDEEDIPCIALEYVDEKGVTQRVTVSSDAILSTPTSGQFYGVHGGIEDLKGGDIVQIKTTGNTVSGIRILMKADNIGNFRTESQTDAVVSPGNGASPFNQLGIMYGRVLDIDTSAIIMNVSDTGDENYTYMVRLDNNTAYQTCAYTLYDKKSNKVIGVEQSEIQKGDKVFLRKRYHHAIDLFIIRD